MVLIGYMGKQDGCATGIGAALVVDAARRAHRNIDIPAWGLALECEGGQQNEKLWNWYRSLKFTPSKTISGLMYAPYENLVPELTRRSPARLAAGDRNRNDGVRVNPCAAGGHFPPHAAPAPTPIRDGRGTGIPPLTPPRRLSTSGKAKSLQSRTLRRRPRWPHACGSGVLPRHCPHVAPVSLRTYGWGDWGPAVGGKSEYEKPQRS
jgi:hypothetical protein